MEGDRMYNDNADTQLLASRPSDVQWKAFLGLVDQVAGELPVGATQRVGLDLLRRRLDELYRRAVAGAPLV
jgi:hypothetical protein